MKLYHGIYVPIITPLDENEKVDEKGFRLLINHAIEHGIHGLFVAGSNGECMALTQTERDRALQIALDEGKGRISILGGVMDSSTSRVIENLKRFEQMGGENAAATPVFYARHSSELETICHYEQIALSTKLNLFVYNIPKFVGYNVAPETLFEIAKFDNLVGYKDSSGNMISFMKVLDHFKDSDFAVFQGETSIMSNSIFFGADGAVPVLAILFPELYLGLYEACVSKDFERMWKFNAVMLEAQKLLSMSKNATSAAKCAIAQLGFTSERVTRPQLPVNNEERKQIALHVRKVNSLIEELID